MVIVMDLHVMFIITIARSSMQVTVMLFTNERDPRISLFVPRTLEVVLKEVLKTVAWLN